MLCKTWRESDEETENLSLGKPLLINVARDSGFPGGKKFRKTSICDVIVKADIKRR
jgi:hypothetical protein